RRGQDVGRAELFEPALSVQEHPRLSAPDLRGLRARALVLGYRHHAHAVLVSAMRDDVHRGVAVAEGAGPRARDGRSRGRLARLEASRPRLIAQWEMAGSRRCLYPPTLLRTRRSVGGCDPRSQIPPAPLARLATGPTQLF